MIIYSTLNIGEFHTNHCEDFLINEHIGTNKKLIAVLDGCTMGKESVFAAHLYGKILRHIAKKAYYKDFVIRKSETLSNILKQIVAELFVETKEIKRLLDLEINELLSTLIIGIIDTNTSQAEFITVGDGLIYIDNKSYDYEQADKPDYLAYHLNDDFERWYSNQNQRLSIPQFSDLSISTDGIFTFKTFDSKVKQKSEQEIIAYLLNDLEYNAFDNFLDRKINHLKQEESHYVTDDLAIIRVIANQS